MQRLSAFLGCPLGPETLGALEQHCSFATMRDNAMVNYSLIPAEIMDHSQGCFMRKGDGGDGGTRWGGAGPGCSLPVTPSPPSAGVVGDWRDHFSPLQNALFNRLYQEEMGDLELPARWPMA